MVAATATAATTPAGRGDRDPAPALTAPAEPPRGGVEDAAAREGVTVASVVRAIRYGGRRLG